MVVGVRLPRRLRQAPFKVLNVPYPAGLCVIGKDVFVAADFQFRFHLHKIPAHQVVAVNMLVVKQAGENGGIPFIDADQQVSAMEIAVCQAAQLVRQDRRLLLFAVQEKEVIDGIDKSRKANGKGCIDAAASGEPRTAVPEFERTIESVPAAGLVADRRGFDPDVTGGFESCGFIKAAGLRRKRHEAPSEWMRASAD